MVEIDEDVFMGYVKEYLESKFPDATIDRQTYLEYDRFVDFVVRFDEFKVMVEVENKASNVADGIKQIQMYCWGTPEATGMVIYPEGTGTVEPEVRGMENSVAITSIECAKEYNTEEN